MFDENRLTRDDFLGMVEVPLNNISKEIIGRNISSVKYLLKPRRFEEFLTILCIFKSYLLLHLKFKYLFKLL